MTVAGFVIAIALKILLLLIVVLPFGFAWLVGAGVVVQHKSRTHGRPSKVNDLAKTSIVEL